MRLGAATLYGDANRRIHGLEELCLAAVLAEDRNASSEVHRTRTDTATDNAGNVLQFRRTPDLAVHDSPRHARQIHLEDNTVRFRAVHEADCLIARLDSTNLILIFFQDFLKSLEA